MQPDFIYGQGTFKNEYYFFAGLCINLIPNLLIIFVTSHYLHRVILLLTDLSNTEKGVLKYCGTVNVYLT